MANTIKVKRGLSSNLSKLSLAEGEMAFATDTKKLYISDTDEPINKDTTYSLSKSGSTITLTGSDGSTTTVTDADTNTTYSAATQSAAGLMSAADKTKLDGIATGANKITVDTAMSSSSTNPVQNKVVNAALANKANTSAIPTKVSQLTNDSGFKTTDTNTTYALSKSGSTITLTGSDGSTNSVTDSNTTYSNMTAATASAAGKAGLVPAPAAGKQASFLRGDGTWVVPTNTTYSAATTSANGLMSSSDKTKLNGIATGAQVNNVVVSTSQPTASTAEVWINPNGQTSLDVLSVFGEYAECMIDAHTTMSQSAYWSDPKVPFSSLKSTSNSTMFTYSSNGIQCNFTGRVLIFANYTCDTTGKEMDPQVSLSNGSPEMRSMINVGSGSASFSFIADVNNGCIITMGVNCNVDSWKVYSSTALRVLRLK